MSGEGEAASDVMTGAVIARSVEGETAPAGEHPTAVTCRNCGAVTSGHFCSHCGQATHLHRSLGSLFHDILHGAFHFEGKLWHTLPELLFHPGRLTRRYIEGERAKFISPMALFLFTVFLMFAVFSLAGGTFLSASDAESIRVARVNWQSGPLQATEQRMAELKAELEKGVTPERRAEIESRLDSLEDDRRVMQALAEGDIARIATLGDELEAGPAERTATQVGAIGQRVNNAYRSLTENPELLLYKLKTNGYKFSWMLIPLSIPSMWLLFFWRRDVHLYDHAVFVTYSISFMMLLFIALSIAASLGASSSVWGIVLGIVAPLHLYKHLRGTYGLSRAGAWIRLFLLLIAITIVMALFSMLLLMVGGLM